MDKREFLWNGCAKQASVPDLRLTATNWASFWLRWQQNGLEAIATLEPVDGRSSASGYRLDSLCQNMARPGQALGTRQEKQSEELKRLGGSRMIKNILRGLFGDMG